MEYSLAMTRFSRMNLPPLCVLVRRVLVHRVLVLRVLVHRVLVRCVLVLRVLVHRVLVHRVLVPRVLALWVAALLLAGSATPQTAQAQENAQQDTQQDTQKDTQQDAQQDSQQKLDLESLHAPFELRKGDITASYKVFLGGFHVARLRFFISETHSAEGTAGGFHYRMSGQTAGWVGSLSKRNFLAVSEAEIRRELLHDTETNIDTGTDTDTNTNTNTESGTAVSDIFYWSQFRVLENNATDGAKATDGTDSERTSRFLAHEALRPRYFLRAPTGEITTLGGKARWAGTQNNIPYGANDGAELNHTADLLAFFARFFRTINHGADNPAHTNLSQQCQVQNKIYDGKYLYRITFESAERKSLRLGKKYTPYQGEFTLCRFSVEALGGFRNEQARKTFPTTVEFWLHSEAATENTADSLSEPFSVPVLFTFRTRFGSLLGYLQEVQRIP